MQLTDRLNTTLTHVGWLNWLSTKPLLIGVDCKIPKLHLSSLFQLGTYGWKPLARNADAKLGSNLLVDRAHRPEEGFTFHYGCGQHGLSKFRKIYGHLESATSLPFYSDSWLGNTGTRMPSRIILRLDKTREHTSSAHFPSKALLSKYTEDPITSK